MENRYRVSFGYMDSRDAIYCEFVSTAENAAIVATAIAKGADADWCVYKDIATDEEQILWDCM